ncbi:MAG: hypothetical protein K0S60_393 [Evtepia sp.]|nr:hypothetical protein [Evtepia sp.]
MRSANWFFSLPLCKKQVKRFWPLWGMYVFVLFILMPVYQLIETQDRSVDTHDLFYLLHQHGMGMAAQIAPWIALVFGVLTAMALWSYLYNNRSVSMMHALPLARETMFFTNYITGILFFLIPNLLIFLLTLGAEAMIGVVAIKSLAIWLLCQTLLCFFYFSFATMFAFVTGHILVLPSLYAIFSCLTLALTMLLDFSFGEFVYGYASRSIPFLNWVGEWLSPPYAMLKGLRLTYPMTSVGGQEFTAAQIHGISVVCAYAIAGLVMTMIAYLLYRYRKLELSGEVIVVSFLRPVFKYGVAICSGLVFGNIFYQVLPSLFSRGIASMLFFLLLWGVIGYFVAEMLLQKSFRVIRKSYKGCLVVMVLLSAAMLAMEWDLSGYEKTVPSADQVEKVTLSNQHNVQIYDPESIARVLALQESVVKEKDQIERWKHGEDPKMQDLINQSQTKNGIYVEECSWYYVHLDYKLKDGSILKREYQFPITEELLTQENTPAAYYAQLVNKPEIRLRSLFPDVLKAEDLLQVEVQTTGQIARERGAEMPSEVSGSNDSIVLSGETAQLLFDAVREDVLAGRLEKQWLLQSEESLKSNYINSIHFTFRGDYNTDNLSAGDWYEKQDKDGKNEVYYEVPLTLQSTASSTLAVLEQLGLSDRIHFMSEYDWQLDTDENVSYVDNACEAKYPVM